MTPLELSYLYYHFGEYILLYEILIYKYGKISIHFRKVRYLMTLLFRYSQRVSTFVEKTSK